MHRISTAIVALCLLVLGSTLHAQTFGDITGTVTDSTGAVVPGATVTVLNTATNVPRTVETNEAGNYTVPFLNPGTYNITAQREGFKAATSNGVILQVSDVLRINFALELGAVTEVIEVAAGAQMLNRSDTALGTVIDHQRIAQ